MSSYEMELKAAWQLGYEAGCARAKVAYVVQGEPIELPENGPLSGEWADGETPRSLGLALGLPQGDEWDSLESDACDLYEEGFYRGFINTCKALGAEVAEA